MLTAVAHDQRWPDVVAGIPGLFFVLLHTKSLNDWSFDRIVCVLVTFNNCNAKMEVGCLKYPGASTIGSQPLD